MEFFSDKLIASIFRVEEMLSKQRKVWKDKAERCDELFNLLLARYLIFVISDPEDRDSGSSETSLNF
jgi:hypothetical protein